MCPGFAQAELTDGHDVHAIFLGQGRIGFSGSMPCANTYHVCSGQANHRVLFATKGRRPFSVRKGVLHVLALRSLVQMCRVDARRIFSIGATMVHIQPRIYSARVQCIRKAVRQHMLSMNTKDPMAVTCFRAMPQPALAPILWQLDEFPEANGWLSKTGTATTLGRTEASAAPGGFTFMDGKRFATVGVLAGTDNERQHGRPPGIWAPGMGRVATRQETGVRERP